MSHSNQVDSVIDLTEDDDIIDLTISSPSPGYHNLFEQNGPLISNSIEEDDYDRCSLNRLKFQNGTCLHTTTKYNQHLNEQTIALNQLIRKNVVRHVFAMTYSADIVWFLQYISDDCSLTLIESPHRFNMVGKFQITSNKLIIRPDIPTENCFHCKLMLIIYDDFIRIVIGSANLVMTDWCLIGNMLFIQDFPKLDEPKTTFNDSIANDLVKIFMALTLPANEYEFLLKFDYSSFKGELVYSIPNTLQYVDNNGLCCLKNKLDKLYGKKTLHQSELATITYATSSLGKISNKYLDKFISMLYPIDRHARHFKIIYPSKKDVSQVNLMNQMGKGPIHFKKQNFNINLLEYFHHFKNYNKDKLSHIKLIIGCHSNISMYPDWYYLGSHNLSQPAWGQAQSPSTTMLNYELGILMKYKDCPFTIPFLYPPPPYKANDRPWFSENTQSTPKPFQHTLIYSNAKKFKQNH